MLLVEPPTIRGASRNPSQRISLLLTLQDPGNSSTRCTHGNSDQTKTPEGETQTAIKAMLMKILGWQGFRAASVWQQVRACLHGDSVELIHSTSVFGDARENARRDERWARRQGAKEFCDQWHVCVMLTLNLGTDVVERDARGPTPMEGIIAGPLGGREGMS